MTRSSAEAMKMPGVGKCRCWQQAWDAERHMAAWERKHGDRLGRDVHMPVTSAWWTGLKAVGVSRVLPVIEALQRGRELRQTVLWRVLTPSTQEEAGTW